MKKNKNNRNEQFYFLFSIDNNPDNKIDNTNSTIENQIQELLIREEFDNDDYKNNINAHIKNSPTGIKLHGIFYSIEGAENYIQYDANPNSTPNHWLLIKGNFLLTHTHFLEFDKEKGWH